MSCIRTRGGKGERHPEPDYPPRRRANKKPGHGTYETDRPPIFTVKRRGSGHLRCFVRKSSGTQSCLEVVAGCVRVCTSVLNTDEWSKYGRIKSRIKIAHRTVRQGRADDGDGVREVHCNGCEGIGAPLRTFLRVFRGVHKEHLAGYVATFETMTNMTRITGEILQRMCFVREFAQS